MLNLLKSRKGRASKSGAVSVAIDAYTRSDGTFDYELYRSTQEAGNKRKIRNVWALEENIAFLANYIRRSVGDPVFGICHGTRRGLEQQWFRERLGCEVIGTEISDTATQFPHTVQWDFHDPNPDWLGAADFIYSNSFDHAYDPEKALSNWIRTLKPRGICIIEHSSQHEPDHANQLDPFGATLQIMPYLVLQWGRGAFAVTEIIDAPAKRGNTDYLAFLVIRRVQG